MSKSQTPFEDMPTSPEPSVQPAARPLPDVNAQQRLREIALSRWENEGGASVQAQEADSAAAEPFGDLASIHTEAVQLRIRVIALENLVIALLAHAPESQLALAREMATFISPRPGYTPHPLTLRAADEMLSLVGRAGPFRPESVD